MLWSASLNGSVGKNQEVVPNVVRPAPIKCSETPVAMETVDLLNAKLLHGPCWHGEMMNDDPGRPDRVVQRDAYDSASRRQRK